MRAVVMPIPRTPQYRRPGMTPIRGESAVRGPALDYRYAVPDPVVPSATAVRRLSRSGRAWRLAAVVLCFGVLTAAQVVDTDDYFPLGSLSQYGAPKDLNGTVRSVFLEARYPGESQPRLLGMSHGATGVARGEVEGQLSRFVDDPSLLQAIANAHAQLRPGSPQPEELYLRRSVQQLRDGHAVGDPEVLTLAQWRVRR